jgi:hypothetical protein
MDDGEGLYRMSDNESGVDGVLAHAALIRRAFGPNRGLLIILMAIWSVREHPRFSGLLLVGLSATLAVSRHF